MVTCVRRITVCLHETTLHGTYPAGFANDRNVELQAFRLRLFPAIYKQTRPSADKSSESPSMYVKNTMSK